MENDRQRLWHFTRGERIAVIALLLAIAATIGVRAYIRQSDAPVVGDTLWIEQEVPAFERQLQRPQPPAKKEKTYTPRQQTLQPVEQDFRENR